MAAHVNDLVNTITKNGPEHHPEQEKLGHLKDLCSNPSFASGSVCDPKQFMSPL